MRFGRMTLATAKKAKTAAKSAVKSGAKTGTKAVVKAVSKPVPKVKVALKNAKGKAAAAAKVVPKSTNKVTPKANLKATPKATLKASQKGTPKVASKAPAKPAAKSAANPPASKAVVRKAAAPKAAAPKTSVVNEEPVAAPKAPMRAAAPVAGKSISKLPRGTLLTEAELIKQPKSEYMSKDQLAFFRQRLLDLQSELRDNAGATTEHLRELAVAPDPADRATLEEEHALELRARDRERKLLKKVEGALLRIDSGEYGYCDETGEAIGVLRLLARPTATLTIEAQERREMKQKMYGE